MSYLSPMTTVPIGATRHSTTAVLLISNVPRIDVTFNRLLTLHHRYFWYNDLHPTFKIHHYVAQAVFEFLEDQSI